MATLKKLIDNGLKVGALVKAFDTVFQYKCEDFLYVIKTNNNDLKQHIGLGALDVGLIEYRCLDTFNGELTTAYDCGIDADALPIAEPIDVTGWAITAEGYVFEYSHELAYIRNCRACLPRH